MIAIISLLVVLVLSLLVTRVATVALTLTGLSRELARFQARSAFTGVGFTTSESENIVNHPVRRRVLMILMLLGNVGIVSVVSSLVLSFVSTGGLLDWTVRLGLLVLGLAALIAVGTSGWVDRRLYRLIELALQRFTTLEIYDYASLLHVGGEYAVAEVPVKPGDWLADRTLSDAGLNREGVLVLGVQGRDGSYRGAPSGDTRIAGGDTLTVYGRTSRLAKIDVRRVGPDGDRCHLEGMEEQRRAIAEDALPSTQPSGEMSS